MGDEAMHAETSFNQEADPVILANLFPPRGIVILASPPSGGKTTLLRDALLHEIEHGRSGRMVALLLSDGRFPSALPGNKSETLIIAPEAEEGSPGSMSWYVNNTFAWGGEIIAVDRMTNGRTLKSAQHEVATEGHAVIATVSKANVWSTLSMLPMMLPKPKEALSTQAERRRALEGLHMVVAQNVVPRSGGGRIAVREFLVVDDRVREALVATEHEGWSSVIAGLIDHPSVSGRSFATAAYGLFDTGLITEDTLRGFTERVIPDAAVRNAPDPSLSPTLEMRRDPTA